MLRETSRGHEDVAPVRSTTNSKTRSRVHTRETIRRVAPVARRPEQSVSVDTSEPDSLRDLHTAIGAQAVGRLMQSLSRPETGHAAPSRVVGPGLQRTIGNQQVQRLFGWGKKKKQQAQQVEAPPEPKTDRERFNLATFQKKDFRPSTTIGKFDVVYRPATGIVNVISKVHFDFRDVEPAYYVEVKNKKDRYWTKAAKKEWSQKWVDSIMTKWGDIAPFKCDKPGYEDVVAKPQVQIELVDDPSKAHYALSVSKAFEKKEGGMRAGGTSGVTREFGGGFQEQDSYDKINNPKVAKHLAATENKNNILPAFEGDRQRMIKALAALHPVMFKWDSDEIADDVPVTAAIDAILNLKKYSALSDLHPIDVKVSLDKDEPRVLLLDRFTVLKKRFLAAGITNPLSAKVGGGAGRSVGFEASPGVEQVKESYLARWDRYTSAHEFGHMLGLLDEYCPAVSPELIAKMYNEGQLGVDEQTLGKSAQNKKGSFLAPQTGYANLLEKTGQSAQAWTKPGAKESGERSTSLMSGGFEVLRQHHVTIWEALTEMTKDQIEPTHWKM